jgi:hypothetical protein
MVMQTKGRLQHYETKFAQFIRLCRETPRGETIVITFPEVLGETYAEIVESLSLIAEAELRLKILDRCRLGCCGRPSRR